MPLTFTVFFCGTGSNSFDVHNPNYPMGEIVSSLASRHEGVEFAHWALVDGPGSGNLQEDEKWVQPGNYSDTRGKLEGKGWEENVAHAVGIIKGTPNWERKLLTDKEYKLLKASHTAVPDKKVTSEGWLWNTYENPDRKVTQQQLQAQKAKIFRSGQAITAVNAVGWSRGAVSCIMFANAMHDDPATRDIPIRIFAVDPVPGAGNFQAHRCSVPSNVQEFVGVYARDECSKGFCPIVPAFPAMARKPLILAFPGRHATLPGNGANDGEDGAQVADFLSVAKLVRHLAERSLARWGATFRSPLNLSAADILQLHGVMAQNDALFGTLKNKSYTYFRDMTDGERTVGWGSEGTGCKFSSVVSDDFANPTGLSLRPSSTGWLRSFNAACGA